MAVVKAASRNPTGRARIFMHALGVTCAGPGSWSCSMQEQGVGATPELMSFCDFAGMTGQKRSGLTACFPLFRQIIEEEVDKYCVDFSLRMFA